MTLEKSNIDSRMPGYKLPWYLLVLGKFSGGYGTKEVDGSSVCMMLYYQKALV